MGVQKGVEKEKKGEKKGRKVVLKNNDRKFPKTGRKCTLSQNNSKQINYREVFNRHITNKLSKVNDREF